VPTTCICRASGTFEQPVPHGEIHLQVWRLLQLSRLHCVELLHDCPCKPGSKHAFAPSIPWASVWQHPPPPHFLRGAYPSTWLRCRQRGHRRRIARSSMCTAAQKPCKSELKRGTRPAPSCFGRPSHRQVGLNAMRITLLQCCSVPPCLATITTWPHIIVPDSIILRHTTNARACAAGQQLLQQRAHCERLQGHSHCQELRQLQELGPVLMLLLPLLLLPLDAA
jgi:hypothetical protein